MEMENWIVKKKTYREEGKRKVNNQFFTHFY